MKRITLVAMVSVFLLAVIFVSIAKSGDPKESKSKTQQKGNNMREIQKTDEEWKQTLTPEQYYITREKGTERPFTGQYDNFFEKGIYKCVSCGADLFKSDTKFDAGCGWPSFYDVMNKDNVEIKKDYSHGMVRDEVICKRCGAHLGHVFEDGPNPTGQRYCINSAALNFQKEKK